jgi:hypothetical protein
MTSTIEGSVKVCAHEVSYWYDGEHPISDSLKKEMEEHASERAKGCIVEGYIQGELNFIDSHTEHEYGGWWKIEDGSKYV